MQDGRIEILALMVLTLVRGLVTVRSARRSDVVHGEDSILDGKEEPVEELVVTVDIVVENGGWLWWRG